MFVVVEKKLVEDAKKLIAPGGEIGSDGRGEFEIVGEGWCGAPGVAMAGVHHIVSVDGSIGGGRRGEPVFARGGVGDSHKLFVDDEGIELGELGGVERLAIGGDDVSDAGDGLATDSGELRNAKAEGEGIENGSLFFSR